jgi:ATP-binding cassette subfamily B protein
MHRIASNRHPVVFVARYLWRHRVANAFIIVAILGAVAASVGARYSMKFLVDAMAGGPAQLAGVWLSLVIFTTCVGADNVLWRVAGWISARVFPEGIGQIRLDLFGHLLGHSTRFFNERFSGALAGRISTVGNGLFIVGNMFIWNVLPPAAATIGGLIGVATVQWQMATVLTAAAAIVAAGIAYAALRGRPLHHAFAVRATEVTGEVVDVITNHGIVRAFANAPREQLRMQEAIAGEAGAQRSALIYVERLRLAHAITVWLLTGAMLAWSVKLWAAGQITTGDVVVCGTFTLALLQASRDLAVALVDMMHQWSRVAEAVTTLTTPHDLPDRSDAASFACRGGQIAFDNVSFCHDPNQPILEAINLRIPAGQRVGIVGPSGAGKSTLIALLQHLYPPTRGRILIDGQDTGDLRQDSLRRALAIVPQDISLFHRSILENIRYGRPEASDAEVVAAAHAANCAGFIARMPEGYETLVGERGVRLSVGQKQRVAIARAILADAPIIVLDEATSALDTESEVAVQQALTRLMQGRTILAIAHRLSTIADFDRVIVIEDGRVVEDGAPDTLRGGNGVFARLWLAQTDAEGRDVVIEQFWSRRPSDDVAWKRPARSARG